MNESVGTHEYARGRADERKANLSEIERLRAAVWDYGEHTISCTVRDGKECDCGFFELLKTVPAPGISEQSSPQSEKSSEK